MAVDLGKGTNSSEVYVPDKSIVEKYFSCKGRLNRERYIFRFLAVVIVSAVILIPGYYISEYLGFFINLGTMFIVFMLGVRRTHDIGKSGWWMLLMFIPIADFIWGLVLIFKKGDSGSNEYGADPLQ